MFTYINENFLHAPSTDLHHDTVRTLIGVTLAQAQEIFLEKQVRDGKKAGLCAKLASQCAYLYAAAVEGVQENVTKAVFEKVWLLLTQTKSAHMHSVAQYWQALADNDSNNHGVSIGRLHAAEKHSKDAIKSAHSFPSSLPASANLGSDTATIMTDITKRHLASVQEKIAEYIKDNDFIYHQPVPNEASLPPIPKMPAAKAISVSELYQGQDINRIIGPDIFQRIVPMSVTESASLYDEEKAKLIRAESERAEVANSEMAAGLDYLKLPDSLNILKGGADQEMSVDSEFARWCQDLSGHASFSQDFEDLAAAKSKILGLLERSSRSLDMEESVCEKMRSKYGADWIQQPSSRLTSTLRSDIKNYGNAINEASSSDSQLRSSLQQFEPDFDEMRSAGETDEADVLYQRALIKAGSSRSANKDKLGSPGGNSLIDEEFEDGSQSVPEQIATVEELMRKLNLIKRERGQVLKDLKDKIHSDDISQVLILNKKSITSQEQQLFKSELEKFRPHQTRLLQAHHKQQTVMKELTRTYGELLQDKRVRSEQSKFETFSRQRGSVMTKYRKVFQAFNDLVTGLDRAKSFYSEMSSTAESLAQNVETFVSNRKAEGGELLSTIEKGRANGQSDAQRERIAELMDRMNMDDRPGSQGPPKAAPRRPAPLSGMSYGQQQAPTYNPAASPPINSTFASARSPPLQSAGYMHAQQQRFNQAQPGYNANQWQAVSPPPQQQNFSIAQQQYSGYDHQPMPPSQQQQPSGQAQYGATGYPPPPPPGPPPPQNGAGYQQGSGDPWAGLSGWR